MPASHNDSYVLSTDAAFQNRVRSSLIYTCIAIENEGWAIAFHRERETFAAQAINSPDTYKQIFANSVATDPSCLGDATEGGTVELTSGNVAAQAALVTDAHIDNAISAQFNSFFRTPGS